MAVIIRCRTDSPLDELSVVNILTCDGDPGVIAKKLDGVTPGQVCGINLTPRLEQPKCGPSVVAVCIHGPCHLKTKETFSVGTLISATEKRVHDRSKAFAMVLAGRHAVHDRLDVLLL